MNFSITEKMNLGARRYMSKPPGIFTVPRVAILYSQPTVAPTVTVVVSPLTVSKRNLGRRSISANNEPSTLYHAVPAG